MSEQKVTWRITMSNGKTKDYSRYVAACSALDREFPGAAVAGFRVTALNDSVRVVEHATMYDVRTAKQ